MPLAAAALARALCERGALAGARRVLRDAGATAQLPSCPSVVPVLFARARLSRLEGEPRDALADARAVGSMKEHYGLAGDGHPWRFEATLALNDLGEETAARELAAAERASAEAAAESRRLGLALHALALTAHGEGRLRHLYRAETTLSEAVAPLEHAALLVDLGGALRRARRRAESRRWLKRGLELARTCGAAATAARAEAELASSCEHPRREPACGLDELTPSERRVAGLAADGLSNPEIAKALFVSLKTVESHLSRTFRKLDIESRHALPGVLGGVAVPAPTAFRPGAAAAPALAQQAAV
jgi:ATP/maltotriose-dependent transcriptional regulator MalT